MIILKFTNEREKTEEIKHYVRKDFEIGSYSGYIVFTTYPTGDIDKDIYVYSDKEYAPDIYFYEAHLNKGKEGFRIQTTAYGALDTEEIEEVMKGYQEALEVVKILTEEFLK